MSLIIINKDVLAEALREFGESVVEGCAQPPLPDGATRWRLEVRIGGGKSETAISYQWIAETEEAVSK